MEVQDNKRRDTGPEYLDCWPKRIQNNGGWLCPTTWVLMFIGGLLILILVPLSFSYVEYDEYAFKKNEIENDVDTNRIYTNGQYGWGINYEPLTFPRTYQKEELKLAIFPSNGLEFSIDIVFFWRVRKDELPLLFKAFGQSSYTGQVQSRANAKIKNRAPDFTIEQYISERPLITRELHKALKEELNLIYIEAPADKFFLIDVTLPEAIRKKDLDAAVQKQKNLEQQNRQTADLVRKETERLEEQIRANITLVALTAESQSETIVSNAWAAGNRTVDDADSSGTQAFFSALSVTDAATKSAYVRYFALLESL
jgi:hypothetical protein